MEQSKPKVKILDSNESHIQYEIEREIRDGYILQGAVQVVPSHQKCHWTYIATMVLKEKE